MFRLAVITDEISQDLETVISFAHTWGLQGVELRSVWEKAPLRGKHRMSSAWMPV